MNPDYYLVLPWHLKRSSCGAKARHWRAASRLIFPLPNIEIVRKTTEKH